MKYIIYKLINIINGKSYIGFSSKNIEARWDKHCRDALMGRPTFLCNAIRKYGIDAFKREVILQTDSLIEARDKAETQFIQEYNTHWEGGQGYNMTLGGEGTMGHKHSKETREKMSKSHTGKKHTEFTKQKLSEQRKGKGNPNYGRDFSKEHRNKLSKSSKGANNPRAKTFLVTTPTGQEILVPDRSKFCLEQELNYFSVAASIRRGRPYKGYLFKECPKEK